MEASILYTLGAIMAAAQCKKDNKPWLWAALLWLLWVALAVFLVALTWLLLPIADLCDWFIDKCKS